MGGGGGGGGGYTDDLDGGIGGGGCDSFSIVIHTDIVDDVCMTCFNLLARHDL